MCGGGGGGLLSPIDTWQDNCCRAQFEVESRFLCPKPGGFTVCKLELGDHCFASNTRTAQYRLPRQAYCCLMSDDHPLM